MKTYVDKIGCASDIENPLQIYIAIFSDITGKSFEK
jgi:hypothetical protein